MASDTQPIIDTIERLADVRAFKIDDGGPGFIAVPKGKELKSIKPFLDEFRTAPERVQGTARLTTLASFIAHVVRFADEGSAVFCADYNTQSPKLIAVFDYHWVPPALATQATADSAPTPGEVHPRFGEHRAQYEFPLSDEWKAWKGIADRGEISQTAFAEFLEERIADIYPPEDAGESAKKFATDLGMTLATSQRLLDLSRGLNLRVNQKVTNVVNLSTGEAQLMFTEAHEGENGPLKLPGGFLLSLPVFRGGAPYQIPVRLRYRHRDGQVFWRFVLNRIDRVWDHAMNEACVRAQTETKLPLFYGTPEA